ncbi:hypothetical protein ACK36G_18600 [Aeromonas veronii]|uniref:hypothetical protein n=1 Tax=Aeromonas TaxID=642 RepID=UPI002E7BD2AC|nr:hypothetical protein [Aeromonas caviae]MEE1913639.1 hypothetical protein [Aeromonas caviae]
MFESITISLMKNESAFALSIRCHLTGRQLNLATYNESAMRPVVEQAHTMQKQGALFEAIQGAIIAAIAQQAAA